jgi:pilin isopeptide linkage protein
MPAGSVNGTKTITVAGSGEGEFGTWSYEKEGVYYYYVSEVNTGERGYTYDKAIYTITDVVKAEDGRLGLSRVVTNDTNRQVTSLSFNNKYDSGGTIIPEGPKPDGPKPDGPKTGDDSNNKLYGSILVFGSLLVMGAAVYLLSARSRKGE